jgi:hypothetical protein
LRILAATAVKVLGLPFAVSRVLFGVPGSREVEPQPDTADVVQLSEQPLAS